LEETNEAIILCGGEGWRLKQDTIIPKPMLKLNNLTLLEYQIRWLLQHKFDHIIIASDKKYDIRPSLGPYVKWSIGDHRGTGGAVLIASDLLKSKNFYLMNVDDIILGYNPRLMLMGDYEAKILVSKPRIGYGRVELRQDLVLGFREKPILDFYVSVGHYVMKKHIVDTYFPDIGNLEELVLPNLAERRILKAERLKGKWITINTYKDYLEARDILSQQ
jgi:NDP-sugar pyrophosphorylase family protein